MLAIIATITILALFVIFSAFALIDAVSQSRAYDNRRNAARQSPDWREAWHTARIAQDTADRLRADAIRAQFSGAFNASRHGRNTYSERAL